MSRISGVMKVAGAMVIIMMSQLMISVYVSGCRAHHENAPPVYGGVGGWDYNGASATISAGDALVALVVSVFCYFLLGPGPLSA